MIKKNIKNLSLSLAVMLTVFLTACGNSNSTSETDASSYPEKDIDGVIIWGEGGATDNISRTLAPLVEEELGGSLVMQNKEGAAGAIATQYVYDQPADGHTLLFGAENPNLYQVLDISERDYMNDFTPISIFGQNFGGLVVHEDSEFETIEDVIDFAKENPGELNMGYSGEGSLPHVASAMLEAELDTEFNYVPYDGDGPLATALLGKEIDATVLSVSAAQEYVDAGDFRMLSVINDEALETASDVPPITESYPAFEKYFPWGPFQGVFVHKDTPESIVTKLTDAFETAQENEEFQNTLESLGVVPLNINGEEAVEYVDKNRSTSTWLLHDAGAAEISPEEFDIPRVDED
ncbi:tripartite tricarboxylate transporter substrate binding protein [Alteribacillus bidgolensis]|uniref:Tripartite-type tricarboxylate transporter, receptor component TctC n=1 Tax=Alteribacillus bidgolensis TaxID=930129 RepID=A0A1G8GZ45_9BACI|nr:tripartite tricarboxylate transporter substrate binding protein [Alteribacillus bidgolensis]SDH99662.1 Tripartite-type tricarboxylate transporter, receptor component TctC [Alteribacillus bidgolensis]